MDTKLRKRSVIIAGHRTSVSLEQAFWDTLHRIAKARGRSVNALIAEVDAQRSTGGAGGANLSSALRVFILDEVLKGQVAQPVQTGQDSQPTPAPVTA